jgi:hypothetical protein
MMSRSLWIALAACSSSTLPPARFANLPAVTVVDDRLDVPRPPKDRPFWPDTYHYDGVFHRRFVRAMELPRPRRALGVNALDEVPDSTWFTNRIGTHEMTPGDVRTGPLVVDSPELFRPWTIKSTKIGGTTPGFIVTDTRGIKYLLKFDGKGVPEIETATHVIVNRLLWASGYNVPEDEIVYFRPADLLLTAESELKDMNGGGDKRKLVQADVDKVFTQIDREADGRIRGLMSRWLPGKAIGGHAAEGTRDDDPNDRIPHELRRDLRGAYPIFAWVDHVDVQEGNFIDSWLADPKDPKRHYVKHYMIDFGKSLGAMAALQFDLRRGHTYVLDLTDIFETLATFGLVTRDWEHRSAPKLRGVALFEAKTFEPGSWHPDTPAYVPFLNADRFDKFWGAKIVARFTRAQIHAAVEAARLTDPAAVEYITDTLVTRQQLTASFWFARVNPLDGFTIANDVLCFDDLAIVHIAGATAATTRYEIATVDHDGRELGPAAAFPAASGGRTCTPLQLATRDGNYTIVRIRTHRPDREGETDVHIARDPASHALRVIGIWRP